MPDTHMRPVPLPEAHLSAPQTRWRLLLDFEQSGAHHMAVDTALHSAFVPGRDRPILRLYSWRPACLSIGYAQPIADADLVACRSAGIDVVRRPTGGRAVLHDRELTYAVIAATDDSRVGGSITQSYQAIARGLLAGLRALGVAAALAPGQPAGDLAARRSGACFAAATRHEVVWNGRKLVGSAQLRRGGALLQHGSILLEYGQAHLASLLRTDPAHQLTHHLAGAAATLAEALGSAPTATTAAAVLLPAFAEALGLELQPDTLTPSELLLAADLYRTRYSSGDWLHRR